MSKKIKKPTRSKLVKQLDQIFSVYIRLSDCDKNGYITCPLCGTRVHWKKAQNMHFISRAVYAYRRDVINCHAGCMRCNVILHGNYIAYTLRMQKKYGADIVEKMINNKKVVKITTPEIEGLIKKYKKLVEELKMKKGLK